MDSQLVQIGVSINLIDTDFPEIQSQFLKALETNNYHQHKLIFESFSQLISLQRVNKNEIQSILILPWLDSNFLSNKITTTHLANAKSIDSFTKVKCLNAISRYGRGHHRLKILNICISSCEIELGVASVL